MACKTVYYRQSKFILKEKDDSSIGVNDTYNQVKIQDGSGWIITKDWAKDD